MTIITTEQFEKCRRALDDDGYLVLRDVVPRDELARFHETVEREFDAATSSKNLFEGGGMIMGHLNCYPGDAARFALDYVRKAGIIDLVRDMRPDLADLVRATMNYNMPGSRPQHYHMDGQYTRDFLICNIAVVDTDLHNGAIDVLPGTNRSFLRFWQYAVRRVYKRSTRLPLRAGDVVLRRSTLWHRGMPNNSNKARPMLAITFGEIEERDVDPFAYDNGAMRFYPNWYSTSRLGLIREKTVAKAPITYSAFRFVRSLFSDKGYDH